MLLCVLLTVALWVKEHQSWKEKVVKVNSVLELSQREKRDLRIQLGSSPNTIRTSEDSYQRSRVGIRGWKIPKRKYQRQGGFWLNQLDRILAGGRQGDKISRMREDKLCQILTVGD